jgi:hypothetical protein
VSEAHQIGWVAVLLATAALSGAAAWSAAAGRRSDGASDHRFAVDRLIGLVVVLIAANAALGALLVAGGARPADPLHFLYGPAALLTAPIGWLLGGRQGTGGAATRVRRDVWVAIAAVVLIGLEARLLATG